MLETATVLGDNPLVHPKDYRYSWIVEELPAALAPRTGGEDEVLIHGWDSILKTGVRTRNGRRWRDGSGYGAVPSGVIGLAELLPARASATTTGLTLL